MDVLSNVLLLDIMFFLHLSMLYRQHTLVFYGHFGLFLHNMVLNNHHLRDSKVNDASVND